MSQKKPYDSTVARIAGNIIGHLFANSEGEALNVEVAVRIARAIVAETKRTEALAGTGAEDEY